jgi:DNA-directed RNA polymerase specialized sigma24 family protein
MKPRGRPRLTQVHDVYAAPQQFEVYAQDASLLRAITRLKTMIEQVARTLAGTDQLLREDLAQEAFIAVWEIDPSRFADADENYFWRAVAVHMRLAARRDRQGQKRRRVAKTRVQRAVEASATDQPVQSPPHALPQSAPPLRSAPTGHS